MEIKPIIAPSLLSADFGNLKKDVQMLNKSKADWIHLDIMDGVFVPNISFGIPVVKAVRQLSEKPLDTHLKGPPRWLILSDSRTRWSASALAGATNPVRSNLLHAVSSSSADSQRILLFTISSVIRG